MDNIWNCAFGIDINCQGDDENMYYKNANQFFEVANSYSLQLSLLSKSSLKIWRKRFQWFGNTFHFFFSLFSWTETDPYANIWSPFEHDRKIQREFRTSGILDQE